MFFDIVEILTNEDDLFVVPPGTSASYRVRSLGGNDNVRTRRGNDLLNGGLGNDILNGGAGDDVILGGAGNDVLRGRTGNNLLWGGIGDDILLGFTEKDTLFGGDGADVFAFRDPEVVESVGKNLVIDVIKDFEDTVDRLAIRSNKFNPNNFSVAWIGTDGNIAAFDFGQNGTTDFKVQIEGGPFDIDASDIYTGSLREPLPDEEPDLNIATSFAGDFVDLFLLDEDDMAPFVFEEDFLAEPVVGSTITQSIVVTNTGTGDATDVLVTADFNHPFLSFSGLAGDGFIDLDNDGNPLTGDGNALTGEFLITNLAAGASTTIEVTLEVNDNYNIRSLTESVTTAPDPEGNDGDYNNITFTGKVYFDAVEFAKEVDSTEIVFNPFPQFNNSPTAETEGDIATTDGQLIFVRSALEGTLNNGEQAVLKSPYTQSFDLDPIRRSRYGTNQFSDIIGTGQTGITEVTSAFNDSVVAPELLAAFAEADETNPLGEDGAITLFEEIVAAGAFSPDAFEDEFKGVESAFVVNTFDIETGDPAPVPVNRFDIAEVIVNVDSDFVVDTTLDVVDANDGLTSLREAIALAEEGDTITFANAIADSVLTLNDSLTIDKSLTIDGGANNITLLGTGFDLLEVQGGVLDVARLALSGGNDGIEVRGAGSGLNLTDVAIADSSDDGIDLRNAANAVVNLNGVSIADTGDEGIEVRDSTGLELNLTNGSIIRSVGSDGIDLSTSDDSIITVADSTIFDNGSDGIEADGDRLTLSITDSAVSNNIDDNIDLSDSEGTIVTLSNAQVAEAGDEGIEVFTSSNLTLSLLNGATVSANSSDGVDLSGTGDVAIVLEDATLQNNDGSGINVEFGSLDLLISGGTIAGNGGVNQLDLNGTPITNVTINGTAAADVIVGSNVADLITSGGGADIIVFEVDGSSDTVTDFTPGADRLDVSALGITALEQMTFSGSLVDFNGANGEQVTLTGIATNTLTAADFVFA